MEVEAPANESDTNEPQDDDPDYVPSRKRSSRIASRMERKAAQLKVVDRNPDAMKRKMKWPPSERVLMLSALVRHGTRNIDAICRDMIYHTRADIEEFIAKEKKMQNYDVVEVFSSSTLIPENLKTPYKLDYVPRKFDSAIESWISLAEASERVQQEKVCSDQILPNLLDYISENEKHPSPEECGGVDYAAIYRALADLMQGDVPQKLNPASSRKMLELFHLLQTKHKEAETNMSSLTDRTFDLFTLNTAVVIEPRSSTASTNSFFTDPAVNPLHLPKSVISQDVVKKL